MNINKAIIVGRITRDPELKSLPSGGSVASFSVATNHTFVKDGNKSESVEFHNIVVFGKQAESSAQYLSKGQMVAIEGRIQTRSWDSDGGKKYRTEIVADRVQFGPRSGEGDAPAQSTYQRPAAPAREPKPAPAQIEYPSEDIDPDDIPF